MTRDEAIKRGFIRPTDPNAPTPDQPERETPCVRLLPGEKERNARAAREGLRRQGPT
jgi:hypothetical protein